MTLWGFRPIAGYEARDQNQPLTWKSRAIRFLFENAWLAGIEFSIILPNFSCWSSGYQSLMVAVVKNIAISGIPRAVIHAKMQ
jgi:hypothetical protein